jgi:hypothetical protein
MRYSRADYLSLEAASNVKHEFLEGQIYGLAGGTPEHAALKPLLLDCFSRRSAEAGVALMTLIYGFACSRQDSPPIRM